MCTATPFETPDECTLDNGSESQVFDYPVTPARGRFAAPSIGNAELAAGTADQPARKTRRHAMKLVARGGTGDLSHRRLGSPVKLALQWPALQEFLAKARRFHPHGRSGSLSQGANG